MGWVSNANVWNKLEKRRYIQLVLLARRIAGHLEARLTLKANNGMRSHSIDPISSKDCIEYIL